MANLPITITISTPCPLSSKDLPKLLDLARSFVQLTGGKAQDPTITNDGTNVSITYTGTIR